MKSTKDKPSEGGKKEMISTKMTFRSILKRQSTPPSTHTDSDDSNCIFYFEDYELVAVAL